MAAKKSASGKSESAAKRSRKGASTKPASKGKSNQETPPRQDESRRKTGGAAHDFIVVGVGASAGGLEALRELSAEMPAGLMGTIRDVR